ncbi:glycosyltransferase family 32 protein [Mesoterricola sediminis]|uniref:Mannosyltransferase OCH1-like enzyme n=1 Tax=Mesoterricola sediminis TaxID=2927980 RepID=A0AA48GPK4_9BACT|nr:glycosyltransferase [Mesoterricola sediminis]BDU75237.1 hypothetical protein METESE_01950 [Mesoterricola sediminis]
MIPKLLHLIWVGDESRRPEACIRSWADHHPDWTVRVWDNQDLQARAWINAAHMRAMAAKEWNGVADMMRWEILHAEGGVLVDADSLCLRPLPEWLLTCEAFACWENELVRPGLIAAGYFGTVPGTPFLADLIEGIRARPTVVDRMAWETVGPQYLTDTWRRLAYANLTILPSHFFLPQHFTGARYTGPGPVYARQAWGSTLGTYDSLAAGFPEPAACAFLHEPDFAGAGWAEVLLSYFEAFAPADPVALVFVTAGAAEAAEARARVQDLVTRTGRAQVPPVYVAGGPTAFVDHLARFPRASWIPKASGEGGGLRGTLGRRLADARRRLTGPRG